MPTKMPTKMLTKNASGQNRTLSMFVGWVFGLLCVSNPLKHKQDSIISSCSKHNHISKACHVKHYLKS